MQRRFRVGRQALVQSLQRALSTALNIVDQKNGVLTCNSSTCPYCCVAVVKLRRAFSNNLLISRSNSCGETNVPRLRRSSTMRSESGC